MKLEPHEMSMLERREEKQIQRRHVWKVWLILAVVWIVAGTLILCGHPYLGIASFLLTFYVGKDFDPAR